ncbi:MAG: aminopeptidase P family protein [Candidatus Woesearchaeota archaeon]|nr:MAG: aminopeptidase P family protein [Candidatus Woesearchaeota archaeon]
MRIKKFQEILNKEKIDAAILFRGNPNINYFSQNPDIGSSSLVIPKDKDPFFISKKLRFENLDNEAKIKGINLDGKLGDFINKGFYGKTIGLDKLNLSSLIFDKFKKEWKVRIVDVSKILSELRVVKSGDEIDKISKNCKILSETFREVLDNFDFKTEREVEVALSNISKEKGGDFCFKPIVASGVNSATPHYMANSSKLKKGFCIIDFGVKYEGYCSDMTRTIFIGKPKKEHLEAYNKVLEAHNLAAEITKPEMKAEALHKRILEYFGKSKDYFIHNLGHGVGIEIHELPSLALESKDILKKNSCFTIEPGLYFPKKFGIRIEELYLLKNKVIPLTDYSKELKIL